MISMPSCANGDSLGEASCTWRLHGKKSASQECFIDDRLMQEVHESKMEHASRKSLYPIERKLMGFMRLAWQHNLTDREDNEQLKHVLHENEPCDRARHSVARYSKLY